jgi:hypothetical protein
MNGPAALLSRSVFWQPVAGGGLEHLKLRAADGGYVAVGVVMGMDRDTPFRLHYKIKCDDSWRTRKLLLECYAPKADGIRILRSNGQGRWRDDTGSELPQFSGCLDVDISATPFTNTLAIRRAKLRPGHAGQFKMVYVSVPSLDVRPAEQRYSCIEQTAHGGRYGYESIDMHGGFKATLPVDADGLVLDYPELFRRVYPR